MELIDLVGPHKLTGVSRQNIANAGHYGDAYAERISFTLDGITYTATEDPEDGYRSSMGDIVATEGTVLPHSFAPVDVVVAHIAKGQPGAFRDADTHDYIEIRRADNDALVLTVGTQNTDDYYPYFVCEFDATALGIVGETE